MIAFVSDIHSNIEALQAVCAYMKRLGVTRVFCLGDVIGYGPDPYPCLEIAMRDFEFTLCGNHEWAITHEPFGFNRVAKSAVAWHKEMLDPAKAQNGDGESRRKAWMWLESLPMQEKHGKFLFVHASPTNPTEEYLLRSDVDEILHELSPKLQRAFEKTPWVTFVGHTHYPGVITEDARFLTPQDMGGVFEVRDGKRVIVNIGSVGQPRDGDNRACFLTLHKGRITYHRVEYDVERTCQKVIATGALDRSLGERLLVGQ